MAAVPISTPPESSAEEFSNFEVSYSYADDSLDDELSDSENTSGVVTATETKANGTEDDYWVRYSALKAFLPKIALLLGNDIVSEQYVLEKAKHMGAEMAKELNDKFEALLNKELEFSNFKLGLFSDLLSLLKP